MRKKPVTYTIPVELDVALHTKISHGMISQFVTQALWDALKKEEKLLLAEFLEADKDLGNREISEDFAEIEGEDFKGMADFDFGEHQNEK